jgi:TniQ
MLMESKRSCLYKLDPMGQNSQYVESLTSYINRLADAHSLNPGTLFNLIYVPLLNKKYLSAIVERGGNGFFDDSNRINGYGTYAVEISNTTEQLTGISNISFTTILFLSELVSERGLLRKTKAWCAACYEEMQQCNGIVYDPLIWSISTSTVCIKHCLPLTMRCPYCMKELLFLSRKGKIGFCSHCSKWLGQEFLKTEQLCNKGHLNVEIKKSLMVETLINYGVSPKSQVLNNNTLVESFKTYLSIFFNNNLALLSNTTKIPRTTFKGWLEGKCKPSLDALFVLCLNTGIDIIDLLLGNLDGKINIKSIVIYKKLTKNKFEYENMKKYLIDVINKNEFSSLTKIAIALKCDRRLLTKKFPDECHLITQMNKELLRTQKENRLKNKKRELHIVFGNLLRINIYPSRRQVEAMLGSGFLKEKELRTEWDKLKNKHLHH